MIAFCKMFTEIDNLILFGNGKKGGRKGDDYEIFIEYL